MSGHVKEQVLRFLRVSAWAFLAALPAVGGQVSWSSLWAAAAGAAEFGYRQLIPVVPLPKATAVPAAPVMSAQAPQTPPPGPKA